MKALQRGTYSSWAGWSACGRFGCAEGRKERCAHLHVVASARCFCLTGLLRARACCICGSLPTGSTALAAVVGRRIALLF
jgi:hypothetical protein